jgi:prophage tail gpP-like protein
MSTPALRLLVGGKAYGGWTDVRVTRSLESMCGAFRVALTDRWAAQATSWPIREEDACAIEVGGEVLLTGAVDAREISYDAGAHAVSIEGRDAARDLVDCAARLTTWEFANVNVLAFAQKLCTPYGLRVSVQSGLILASVAVPKKLSIEPGDTAANALENVCRVAGLLPISDGQGGLLLTRSGTARCTTALVEGANILSARIRYDRSNRFGEVFVLGSHAGTDEDWGTAVTSIRGSAKDANIDARRITYVRPEGSVDAKQATARAQWEVAVRAARSVACSVVVQGWQQADGSLWPLNKLVRLMSPLLEVDADLLITQVEFGLGNGGSTTHLELRRPEAFKPVPVVPAESGLWKEIAKGV